MTVVGRRTFRVYLVKLGVAIAVIAASLIWLFPDIRQLIRPDSVVDGGSRGLVVIATEGGGLPLTLHIDQLYDSAGGVRLLFYFTAEGIVYGDNGNAAPVQVQASFIGSDFASGVKCGKYSLPQVSFDELSSGTKHAVDVDAISERASATNYDLPDGTADRTQRNQSELDHIHT